MISLLLTTLTTAQAVPVKLTQQGRLLDASGAAISGTHLLSFRIYDSQLGGNVVWEEGHQLSFTNGYYAAILGADIASNPLDDSLLADPPLYLEVEVDNNGPVGLRQEIVSAPYSRLSGTAANLSGGIVDASEIRVAGSLVIDGTGNWVGPTTLVNWADIQNIPLDLIDGDDDTLAGINCNAGEILGWDGSLWVCSVDNGLTEAEVEAFVTNDPLNLAAGSMVDGIPILTQGDGDTLSGLSCQDGELAKWDMVLSQWVCGVDVDTDTQLSEVDVEAFVVNDAIDLHIDTTLGGEIIVTQGSDQYLTQADVLSIVETTPVDLDASSTLGGEAIVTPTTDQVLGDSDVVSIVENNVLNLDSATTLGGQQILTSVACANGEILSYDNGQWVCTSFATALDGDQDGLMAWADCDDNDPTSNAIADDADCDTVLTADDCNDSDASLTYKTGSTANCPADSCLDILNDGLSIGDGTYWLTHNGQTWQNYCDMSTDGGGWTLVGSVAALEHNDDNGVLDGFDSIRWGDRAYLGDVSSVNSSDALGLAYESVSFTDFMLQGANDQSKIMAWRMGQNFDSLYDVFSSGVTHKTTNLLIGNHTTLDWRGGCGAGNGPDGTGPTYYGFNVAADTDGNGGNLFNGFTGGWCAALAGWGRDNSASNYTGGGLGAGCQGRGHQMGRHYHGYGDACNSSNWTGGSYDSFEAHAFFVR